jgi:uncharacterized membrane protein
VEEGGSVKQFFQGAWLGHPLHPLLVELPVALWPLAFLFDVLTRLDIGGNVLVRAAFLSLLLGLLSAIPAAVAGIMDWTGVKQRNPAWRLGLVHLFLNASAIVLTAVGIVIRIPEFDAGEVASLPLLLSGAVALLVAVSSYLGGRMVYEYGISVARLTREYWQQCAQEGGARTKAE